MGGALEYGVQSYCFRHFSNNVEVAKKVKEIGVDSIELYSGTLTSAIPKVSRRW